MASFYSDFFTGINGQLAGTITNTASAVIGAITPVATTLLLIYVALWAWSMARGMITEPVTDGATRIAYLSIITAIALSIGYYSGFLSDWLWNSPDAMAGIIAPGTDPQGNMGFLDGLFLRYDVYASRWYQAAEENPWPLDIPNGMYVFIAILLWLCGIILTGYAAALLILAKIMLAVLLGIGPMFVLALVFQVSKRFFDTWLGQCLSFVFMVILVSALFAIVGQILSQTMATEFVRFNSSDTPDVMGAMTIIALSAIVFLLLLQIPSVAAALGGGVAVSTMGGIGIAYAAIRKNIARGARASRFGFNELSGRNRSERRFRKMHRRVGVREWREFKQQRADDRAASKSNTVKRA